MLTTLSAHKNPNKFKAILFDLDGTLIDSAPGIFNTIEFITDKYQLDMQSHVELRPYLGEGLAALILHSNPELSTHVAHQYAKEGFDHYKINAPSLTKLFPEVEYVLKQLNIQQIPWGIVTNKLRNLTLAIFEKINILNSTSTLICKDDLNVCKPDPYPLLKAVEQLDVTHLGCLYIGDSIQDMEAARRANITGIIAMYGYLPKDIAIIESWPHKGRINNIKEILDWITI
jgi:phosphoglycolate phosphatase